MRRSLQNLFFTLPLLVCVLLVSASAWAVPLIDAGGESSQVARQSDGMRYAWGDNFFGTLGDGSNFDRFDPIVIGSDTNWVAVAAGDGHALGIKGLTNDELWAWGANNEGQVGNSTFDDQYVIQQIAGSWSYVAAGDAHSLAIKSDGTLWAWGWNIWGQLGVGVSGNQNTPQLVDTGNWGLVSAGSGFSLALKSDGSLWAWGSNDKGQLGLGDNVDRNFPELVNVPGELNPPTLWLDVSAGDTHTLAIRDDGSLWAWGENGFWQLGLNDSDDRLVPAQVGVATNWQDVSAGGFHSLAISGDGVSNTLWSWGRNTSGQLGLNDTTWRIVPTPVSASTDWAEVAAGRRFSMALQSDGTLSSWGDNGFGQLGLGFLEVDPATGDPVGGTSEVPLVVDLDAATAVSGDPASGGTDSDGDGVADPYDTFPLDPDRVSNGDLDQNGLLEMADYQLAVQIVLGKVPFEDDHRKFGNVAPLDTSGVPTAGLLTDRLTAADALIILRRVNQFISW